MAVERRNPLPPNQFYWVDVGPEDAIAFGTWLNQYKDQVRVRARRSGADGWEWVSFETVAPLVWWNGPGFPTIGEAGQTEDDVKQVPRAPSSGDVAAGLARVVIGEIAPWIVVAAVGAAVVKRLLR